MPFEMNDYLKKFAEKVEALIQEHPPVEIDEMKEQFVCLNMLVFRINLK